MELTLTWSILIPILIGLGVGALVNLDPRGNEYYRNLIKPSFNPPGYAFFPVWTALYASMGFAYFLIQVQANSNIHPSIRKLADFSLMYYWIHFVWNLTFTPTLKLGRNLRRTYLNILVLWIKVVILVCLFTYINYIAGLVLLPYLAWVTFATYLTYTIVQLNQGQEYAPLLS